MKAIRSWHDLREFGIWFLTGESCGYGGRLLCDLTEHGAEFFKNYFGGNVEFKKNSNWNSGAVADLSIVRLAECQSK